MGWLSSMWAYVAYHLLPLAISEQTLSDAASHGSYSQIPGGDLGTLIHFYLNWSPYLHLNYGFLHAVAGWLQSGFFHAIFNLNNAFEKIFNAAFALMGWDGTLSAKGSPLHGLYMVISTIGWAMLIVGIVLVALQSMGHETKWSKVLPNILMVALTITVLPLMMRTVGGSSNTPGLGDIAQSAATDVRKAGSKGMTSDLALQPIQNNVIDLTTLVRKDWAGYTLKPSSAKFNAGKWNAIDNANDVRRMSLGDYLDKDTVNKKLHLDKDHKVAATILQYHLADESEQANGGYYIIKNASGAGMGSLNDEVYARYTVNWIGLIGQSIILAVTLIIATFRVVEDIFELTAMNLVAPLLAYQSIRSTKKLRDLISSIVGLYMSLVLILLVLKLFFIFVAVAPSKVPTSFNWIERSFLIMVIYGGGSYGMFKGVSYFERITGVSQGFADEFGHAATGVAAAGMFGGFAGAMAGRGMSAAGNVLNRHSSRSSNSQMGSSSQNMRSHASTIGGDNTNLMQNGEAQGIQQMASTTNSQNTNQAGGSNVSQANSTNNNAQGLNTNTSNNREGGQQINNGGNQNSTTTNEGGDTSQQSNVNTNPSTEIAGQSQGVDFHQDDGVTGASGVPGVTGLNGNDGAQTAQGVNFGQSDGAAGTNGTPGAAGMDGMDGGQDMSEGPNGQMGSAGIDGTDGPAGTNGLDGTERPADFAQEPGAGIEENGRPEATPDGMSQADYPANEATQGISDANDPTIDDLYPADEATQGISDANDPTIDDLPDFANEEDPQNNLTNNFDPQDQDNEIGSDDLPNFEQDPQDQAFEYFDNSIEPDSNGSGPITSEDPKAAAIQQSIEPTNPSAHQQPQSQFEAARDALKNTEVNNHGAEAPDIQGENSNQNVLQRFGNFTTEKSTGLMKKSESYIMNNRFNLSARGRVNGRSSDHLD